MREVLMHLGAEQQVRVESYLAQVFSALDRLPADEREDIIESLAEHLGETLEPGADMATVESAIEALGDIDPVDRGFTTPARSAVGRVMGVPYDLRAPDAARITKTWWDPAEPRWIVPRVWGVGWAVNFGALAVSLGLIEPDAEDVPFESTPDVTLRAALMIPVTLTLGMVLSFAILWDQLPSVLPSHWNLAGEVDGQWPRGWTLLWLASLSVLPSAIAVWSAFKRGRHVEQSAWIAGATLFSGLAAAIWVLTVVSVFTSMRGWWLSPVAIVGALCAVFLELLWMARAGRDAEQHRDMESKGVA